LSDNVGTAQGEREGEFLDRKRAEDACRAQCRDSLTADAQLGESRGLGGCGNEVGGSLLVDGVAVGVGYDVGGFD
jgi:hypothetical protein